MNVPPFCLSPLRDHTAKQSLLQFLRLKDADGVGHAIARLMDMWGDPAILQSDNGTEFVNSTIKKLCKDRCIRFVQGRVYHPQSQGCVEQSNGVVKRALTIECLQNNLPPNAAACFVGKVEKGVNTRKVFYFEFFTFNFYFHFLKRPFVHRPRTE